MANNKLMEAFVVIKAKLDPLRKGLAKAKAAVIKAVASMQAAFSKMLRIAKKAFIGLAVVMGISTFAAIKQEEAEARLAVVLKSTGYAAEISQKQLIKQAQALQRVTTYGDEAIMSLQAILLTFKAIKGDVFERTTKIILDMSQALGQDLKEGAIQVGKALNDPILGVTALRRVGVMLTEQQNEMVKTFVKTGNIVKAQTLILRELESEFGGMASVVNTTRGSLTQMKNAVGDLLEKLAGPFLDNITKTAQRIRDWSIANQDAVGRVAAKFDHLIEVGNHVIAQFLGPMLNKLGDLAKKFAGFATEAKLENAIWKVGEWADGIFGRIKILYTSIKNMWDSGNLGKTISDAFKHAFDKTKAQFEQWGKQLKIIVGGIADIIGFEFGQKFGDKIGRSLINMAEKIGSVSTLILLPLQKAMLMGGTALIEGTFKNKAPNMKGVLESAGKVPLKDVTAPTKIPSLIAEIDILITAMDKQVQEKWKQIRQEFGAGKDIIRFAMELSSKAGGDGSVTSKKAGAAKFGVSGLREAWTRMVSGMKADPMVSHQKETTNEIKRQTTILASAIREVTKEIAATIPKLGTVGV